jgi:PAS domain S-box-containing protein
MSNDVRFMIYFGLLLVTLVTLATCLYLQCLRSNAQKTLTNQVENQRLTELINALPAKILLLDQNGLVVRSNERWDNFVGSIHKSVGEHFTQALGQFNSLEPYRNNTAIAHIDAALNRSAPSAEFEQEVHINGRHYWLHTIVRPMHEDNLRGVMLMQIDISQRKNAEYERDLNIKLMRHSEQLLAQQKIALDDHAAVTSTDLQGRITYVNDKFLQLSGYSREQIIGQHHRVNKSSVHPPEFFAHMLDVISTGQVWHGDIANFNNAGEIYWVDSSIAPLLDEHGLPTSYITIQTDITQRKQAQQELAEVRLRELATGNAIQRALLLEEAPRHLSGMTVATYSEPSQGIDGDFFAFSYYSPDCFDVLVGDVMGKGINAALIGAAVKNDYHKVMTELLADSADNDGLPCTAAVFNALHARLTPRLIALDIFVTMALYRIDRAHGQLSFVNGGHTPAILSRQSGDSEAILGHNLPLGVIPHELYQESVLALAPGDALALYSDGMSETRNPAGEEFGERAMQDLIARARACGLPPASTVQMLRKALRDFAGSQVLTDDQTMVMIETHASHDAVLQDFALERAALPALRQFIEQHTGLLTPESAENVLLATFEAATNVIRHVPPTMADGSLSVRISHNETRLCVELFYLGESFFPDNSALPDFSGDVEGGFGLYIIRHMVDHVEYLNPLGDVCCIRLYKNFSVAGVQV